MKLYKVRLTSAARRDLISIYGSVREGSTARTAQTYTNRIRTHLRTFDTAPKRGTERPDLEPGLRVTGFEGRIAILFRVDEREVVISRILYGGQDIERALGRTPDRR